MKFPSTFAHRHFPFAFLSLSLKQAPKAISTFALSTFLSYILHLYASLFIVIRSFDFSIATIMLPNLDIKEHKIFTTTYWFMIISLHAFIWFTNRVILVVKSFMISFSFIWINSNWRLKFCNLTTITLPAPAYTLPKIFHACFNDLQSPTLSKLSISTYWGIKNNALKSFSSSSWDAHCVVVASSTRGYTSFLITSKTSW